MYDLYRGFYSRTSYHYIDEEGFCILQSSTFSYRFRITGLCKLPA